MASFNDIIRGTPLTRLPFAKDVTAADVHVSTALGNEEPPKGKKRKKRPHAFIGYDQKPRMVVVPEELGPGSNAEDGPAGATVKRLEATTKPTMSRSDANYVDVAVSGEWCQDCSMFDAVSNLCSLVEGPISRGGHCDHWRYRPHADGIDHVLKRYDSPKDLPDAVRGKLKGKKRRQWMHVFNSSLGTHGDEGRAFAEAWSTVKKGRSDVLSGEPMVGVGGRRLEPFDAGAYFTPLRHDPVALSHFRPDQVMRFLAALTRPNKLQVMPVAIADLIAVEGRVSGEAVQGRLDGSAEVAGLVPPVVVYANRTMLLVDGLDRTVAAWLGGADVIDVAYKDVDDYALADLDADPDRRSTAYALLEGVDGRTLTSYVDGTLSVPFMVDPAFFSHLRPDQVPKFIHAVADPSGLADSKVSLATLVAIQGRVSADVVAEKVERPSKKPPLIVRMNGVNYIADGHARLAAAWLRGDDEVTVKLTDITLADNGVRPVDLVKSTMADRSKAREKLAAAEGLVKSISVQVDEVNRQLVEKQAEADRLRVEADRYELDKRAAVEKFEAEKRVEVEKFEAERLAATKEKVAEAEHALKVKRLKVDRKLESAGDYVEEMARRQKKLDRYVADQQESVDRQVAKIEHDLTLSREDAEREVAGLRKELDRKIHEVDLKLQEANRYVEYVAKVKKKTKQKSEQAVEQADAYLAEKRTAGDAYWAEKRSVADQYAIEKRAAADQYDLDRRTDADRYAVAKRQEVDQVEFDRKRELNKMELGQLDEIQNRATTELSARQVAQIQVLKKQLKTGARRLKVDVKKTDVDKRQIFGFASVVTKDGVPVVDRQGDIIPVEELETAVYNYMLNSRDGGHMHTVKGVARCIESMMWTDEKAEAMGVPLPDGMQSWWVGYQVDCPEYWAAIRAGEINDFSIGGQAVSTQLED